MRSYKKDMSELVEVICNKCEKKLNVEKGYLKEGIFEGSQKFDYFSRKDGMEHHFDLCEDCYNQIIFSFAIPVEELESTEIF